MGNEPPSVLPKPQPLHQTIRHWREVARELSKATNRHRIGELIIELSRAVAQQKPSKLA